MKDFAKTARPFTNMTGKDSHRNWADPTVELLHAYEALKLRLITSPLLALPKAGKPDLDTDTSVHQLGATLLQL